MRNFFSHRTREMLWVIPFAVLSTGAAQQRSVVVPPEDVTGKVGGAAVFKCEVDFSNYEEMDWTFNGNKIYSYLYGNEDYPLGRGKYSVTQDKRTFELSVKDLQYSDGGQYTCHVPSEASAAHLVVIGTPHLYNSTSTPYPEEGSVAECICTAQCGGPNEENIPPEQYPKLQMFLDGALVEDLDKRQDVEVAKGIKIYNFTQVYNMTLNPGMDGKLLMCTIKTLRPAMSETVTANVIVIYAVHNISYAPQSKQHFIGTMINCSANGNPKPKFTWNNLKSEGTVIDGPLLKITEQMVGNNVWRCTARNTFGGSSYEKVIEVHFEAVLLEKAKAVSVSWKTPVSAAIPLFGCIMIVFLAMHIHMKPRKGKIEIKHLDQKTSETPGSVNLSGTITDETSLIENEEEEVLSESVKAWIDPNDEKDCRMELENVVLEVSSRTVSQPVMISVKKKDTKQLRQRQIKSKRYDKILKPVIQLSLQPLGLKLSEPAKVNVKRKKFFKKEYFLIFNKGFDSQQKDQWIDITNSCDLVIREQGISLSVQQFVDIEIFLSSSSTDENLASGLARNILNDPGNELPMQNKGRPKKNIASLMIEKDLNHLGGQLSSTDKIRYDELNEIIDGLKCGKDLDTAMASRIEKTLSDLKGNLPTEGPSALIKLIKKTVTLIWSDHFVHVTKVMAQNHAEVCKERKDDPLLCLVEVLENDFLRSIIRHSKKLLQVIQELLKLYGSINARRRCVRVLITNTEEWRLVQGEMITEKDKSNSTKLLQWNYDLIKILKGLGKKGADPAWSPEGYTKGSNLHLFVAAVKHVISHKSNLTGNLMDLLEIMMNETSLSCSNVDGEGMTILHALVNGKKSPLLPDISEQLLQIISQVKTRNPILLDTTNGLKHTPLHTFVTSVLAVCVNDDPEIDRDVHKDAAKKWRANKEACVRVVQCLISPTNIDMICKKGKTPLQELTKCADEWVQYPDVFLELVTCLKSDSNINFLMSEQSPLFQFIIAAETWTDQPDTFLEVVRCLKSPLNMDFQIEDGYTPLHAATFAAAAWKDHPDVFLEVVKCLKSESNLEFFDDSHRTPLLEFTAVAAEWKDHPDVFLKVVNCLKSPLCIDFQTEEGFTPLHAVTCAAGEWKDNPDMFFKIIELLKSTSNIDLYSKRKLHTPLLEFTIAAKKWADSPDIFLKVVVSLKSQNNVDIKTNNENTPLHQMTLAVDEWKKHPDKFLKVVQYLKSQNNIDFQTVEGLTPLHAVTATAGEWKDHPDMFLEVLKSLKSPKNLDIQIKQGYTPLYLMALAADKWKDNPDRFLEVFEYLQSPINTNLQTEGGFTPLHAVSAGAGTWGDHANAFLKIIKNLASASNINILTKDGNVPLHLVVSAAEQWKDQPDEFLEVVKCLKSAFNVDLKNRNGATALHLFKEHAKCWGDQSTLFLKVVECLTSQKGGETIDH